ncbi:MAG: YesL family protein [Cellulosilyticaceae bacterium]
MKIFSLDGPVYRVGTEIADAMILSVYWLLCCLPIVTIGASTTAVFYVYGKKVRDEDCYLTKDFFKSFKENFKQSIPITLILGALWLSCGLYMFILNGYPEGAPIYIAAIALFLTVEVTVITLYAFAILSRFHMTVRGVFLTAVVLSHRHIVTSGLIVLSLFAINYLVTTVPLLLIMLPVITMGVASCFLQKIFTDHIKAAEELKMAESGEEDEEADEQESEEYEEDDFEKNTEDKDFLKYI